MDRIQPLRIMAGHLSDVDVSSLLSYLIAELYNYNFLEQSNSFYSIFHHILNLSQIVQPSCLSVCNGMPTATILQLVLVTKRLDCGMYKVENVFGFLLVTGV